MSSYNDRNVIMEGVRLLPGSFRNFSGREGQYNREGDRNFAVLLPDDLAQQMINDGWNVKYTKPREVEDSDEVEPGDPYLKVTVNYKGRAPRIVMITSRNRTNLGEKEVDILDTVDITNVDLIIRPYEWVVNKKTGISAYLQSLYVTIEEDYLQRKYAMIDEERDRD